MDNDYETKLPTEPLRVTVRPLRSRLEDELNLADEQAGLPVSNPFEDAAAKVRRRAPVRASDEASLLASRMPLDEAGKALLGIGGERYKTWPEVMVRSGTSLPGDVLSGKVDPTSEEGIQRTQDLAGLGVTGPLAMIKAGATGILPMPAFFKKGLPLEDRMTEWVQMQKQHHQNSPSLMSDSGTPGAPLSAIAKRTTEMMHEAAQKELDKLNLPVAQRESKFNELLAKERAKEGLTAAIKLENGQVFSGITHGEALIKAEKTLGREINDKDISSSTGFLTHEGKFIEPSALAKQAIAEPFYSAVENTVKNAKMEKGTADQWLGYLRNQPGVKPEELQWTGLNELPAGQISKAQLEQHIAENKVKVGEVTKVDRDILLDASEKHVKYKTYQLPGGPLSRDTEILTRDGWKRMDIVTIYDEVMTRKDEDGSLEWQQVQAVPMVYADKLYHFFNQSIDMQVTENHKMVVKKRRRNTRGIYRITAKELWHTSECVIPLTGIWKGKGTGDIFGINACDVAEFIGWYLAEGSYKHKNNGVKNTIQIAQCRIHNPENCDRLETLFERLNLTWKYYGNGYGISSKLINENLLYLLHNQPTSEGKYVPRFLFNQSKEVIESLLMGLILGDGNTTEAEEFGMRQDRRVFFSKSKQLADDVQVLALLVGYRASVRQRPSGLYVVGINRKEWNSVDDSKYAIIDYNDYAYCVTVENHCIYVRRNGIAAFTGNTNYKETLLTLPSKNKSTFTHMDNEGNIVSGPASGDYKSSHWDEPNVLAHIRTNDRMIDGKKTLHIEEIQSDWHQAGRKEGYKGQLTPEQKAAEAEYNNLEKQYNEMTPGVKAGEIHKKMVELRKIFDDPNKVSVPDAPFKKTWDELALKRMVRKAAEEGYDAISWTPGEAQAARYDLSKHVDKVNLVPQDSVHAGNRIKFRIDAFKDNNKVIEHYAKDEAEIASVVGKEVAEKLLNTRNQHGAATVAGQDLKVGGEGMKSFYDKMLVDKANALGKKFGSKVESKDIQSNPKGWHITLPDQTVKGKWMVKSNDYNSKGFHFDTKAEAEANLAQQIAGERAGNHSVHYLPITKEMREYALTKGFPLFSAGLPVHTPVSHDPFKYTPVDYDPFNPLVNKNAT